MSERKTATSCPAFLDILKMRETDKLNDTIQSIQTIQYQKHQTVVYTVYTYICSIYRGVRDKTFTHATCVRLINIVPDQMHPFMEMVFPNGIDLFQQDNGRCRTAYIVREHND